MVWLLVLLLVAVALFGGGMAYRPNYGYYGFSPAVLVLLILVVLVLAHVIVL